MKHSYIVTGMTCNGCVAAVKEKLSKIDGVLSVSVNLEKAEAEIEMKKHLSIDILQESLNSKYKILENTTNSLTKNNFNSNNGKEETKLKQLKPLLLILFYLFSSSFLLNFNDWNFNEAMLDFMGLFFIVFSFFKFLDLKGFPESFKMYDPLAKILPFYGWIYPFIETLLGLLFLMRLQIPIALIVSIIILGITTIGVTRILFDKKSIQCACLGTALKLPMTEATFIENAIMLVMAIVMLIQMFV
tara:strand:- start:1798 stop:2532 length:735 start_codon:yes stop_codon:yes gene_type:complete